ncbi:UNVERIFIED_CONTAM: hypothetical protein PYX00_010004 [Menopon gallinae]|uniref:Short-chain dehydrogenase/reductase 3 n=1 Tax=Menopon gallinae TaxID=328185 RepID=A0AAW2HDY1_9NEOP
MDNPRAGEENGATKISDTILLILEIFLFLARTLVLYVHGVYKVFFPPEEKSVAGEIVLITGTGHGIGKELARQYGELGAEVVCVDINKETNNETVEELTKMGIKAHGYTCDVSSWETVNELQQKVEKEVGDVSILVNNAGIMPCKSFFAHKPEEIRKMFEINVFAHFWMLQAFLPKMMKKNKGHVVAISSVAGLVGGANVVPYCGSKFAVRGYMEGIAEEFRKENRDIKFTTIYPFITDTGLCKRPRIRFSNCMKILSPAETAAYIITAQRRNYNEAAVPPYLFFVNAFVRTLPRPCGHQLIDFLDSGVEPHV